MFLSCFYFTCATEPDGPPAIIDARATSSQSIQFMLEVPAPDVVNGIILGYHIFYSLVDKDGKVIGQESMVDVKRNDEKTTIGLLENLEEYTWYSLTVRAYTSIGYGPNTTEARLVRTFEDGTNTFIITIIILMHNIYAGWRLQLVYTRYMKTVINA